MINFVSLDAITEDILYIARGSKVSGSETLSVRQIESWVHQYRALLIKRDLDKGKSPNDDYIQELTALKLVSEIKPGNKSLVDSDIVVYRTDLQLPKTIDLNFRSGLLTVTTLEGKEIQLVDKSRVQWQSYKKFIPNDMIAYQQNGYVYVQNAEGLSYITIRGIFEVPTEVGNFVNTLTQRSCMGLGDPYPIPINMLGDLKTMILKGEMNITLTVGSDNKNDSQNKVESNQVNQPTNNKE